MAGARDHGLGDDARTPQVLGIVRINPVLGGGHQETAVRRTLGQDFGRQFEVGGELGREVCEPRNVETLRE